MQPFGKATFLWEKLYHVMRAHVMDAATLIALEKQGADEGCREDFGICRAAILFGVVTHCF